MSIDDRLASLSDLLLHLPVPVLSSVPEAAIQAVVSDSRKVKPGSLFVALLGDSADGHRFIPDAIQRGAAAVVGTLPVGELPVPYVQVADTRRALPYLAAAYHDFPSTKLIVIGVTGTDGKTTTTSLISNILLAAGLQTGMISTVRVQIGNEQLDTGFHVTTPDAPDVQRFLAHMVEAGLTHVVLEATSHGLEQHRVDACQFDVGVVTNITHEHLDYHGSYEAYRDAKALIFNQLAQPGTKKGQVERAAVLNQDDSSYGYLEGYLEGLGPLKRISYGFHSQADLRAERVELLERGLSFLAVSRHLRLPIRSRLVGDYNVSNCLAALAATLLALQVPAEAAQEGIASLPGIPGRMERIDLGQDFTAIVDFAHTPNALRQSLQAARQMANGRVIVVFGSAGLRDRAKRRMMAEVSAELADLTILTAEDPRTESLPVILGEMVTGLEAHAGKEGETFWRIEDRGEAIRFGISLAKPGDLVIACGKGHEQSMCFGETEYAWDDRQAMRAALAEQLGLEAEPMPRLPTQDQAAGS